MLLSDTQVTAGFPAQLLLGAVQVELEADAEAALLVCPRSPALVSANPKSRESVSNVTPQRAQVHCSTRTQCHGLPKLLADMLLQADSVWLPFCLELSDGIFVGKTIHLIYYRLRGTEVVSV